MAKVFSNCNLPQSGQSNQQDNFPNAIKGSLIGFEYDNYCDNVCINNFSWRNPNTNDELDSDFTLECKNICRSKVQSNEDFYYIASQRKVLPMSFEKPNTDPGKPGILINYSVYNYQTPKKQIFDTNESNLGIFAEYFNAPLRNDSITTIKLDSSTPNIIYACGHKITQLNPIFPNMFTMSPDTVLGGNSEEILANIDNTNPNNTKTAIVLNDPRFGGMTNFNYNAYIQSFKYQNSQPANFDQALTRVFCDFYKQDVVANNKTFDCPTAAKKYGFDVSRCTNCNRPDSKETLSILVRIGKMTENDCEVKYVTEILGYQINSKGSQTLAPDYSNVKPPMSQADINEMKKYCNIQPFNGLSEQIFSFYKNLSNVNIDDSFFIRNGWSQSTSTDDDTIAWNSQSISYHPCLINRLINPPSNKELTSSVIEPNYDSNNPEISLNNFPERVGCYPSWHIYNTDNYTDTSITVSDGDFLSIKWGGNFVFGNGLNLPFFDQSAAKTIAIGDNSLLNNFSMSPIAQYLRQVNPLSMMSRIDFEGLKTLVGEAGDIPHKVSHDSPPQGIEGEICMKKTIYDLRSEGLSTWYGLNGNINRGSGCSMQSYNSNTGIVCSQANIKGDTYAFEGILQGIGNDKNLKLRFSGPQNDNEKQIYQNSIITGGNQVFIEWGGCPMRDGEGLEIALAQSSNPHQEPSEWISLTVDQITKGFTLAPSTSGVTKVDKLFDTKFDKILIRVNTSKYTKQNVNDLNDKFPDGSYGIDVKTMQIKNTDAETATQNTFDITKKIAVTVFSVLIGNTDYINDPSKKFDGSLIQFATKLPQSFSDVIQLLLVLYIAITGLGFVMGTIKSTQQELVNRVFKVSIIFMVLNNAAWEWFIQNYVRLFIVGSLQLAILFQDLLKQILNNEYIENHNVFDLFSVWKPFWYVVQETFTYRLLALAFSSLPGFAIAAVIVAGVVVTFKVILEAVFVYISAIITQSLLLLVAPFFLAMKLFEGTKDLFDNWAKQVIAFSLIPVAVTIAINMFLLLLIIGLDATMNFSYCTGCMIEIFGFCLVPAFYTLGLLFFPPNGASDFLLPSGLVSGALTFIIVVHTGYHVVSLAVGMITRIITFRFETLGRESMTGLGSNLIGSVKDQIGWRGSNQKTLLRQDFETGREIAHEKKIAEIGKKLDKIKRD